MRRPVSFITEHCCFLHRWSAGPVVRSGSAQRSDCNRNRNGETRWVVAGVLRTKPAIRSRDACRATLAEADPLTAAAAPPPEPQHTGFQALVRTVGSDFVALPKRRSTWVFVGIGAGGALLAHPADDEANARLVGSRAVGRFFAPGKGIGSVWTHTGVSVGLYMVGRYVLPHARRGEDQQGLASWIRPLACADRVTGARSRAQARCSSRSPHGRVLLVSLRPCRDRVCCRVGARTALRLPGCMANAPRGGLRRRVAASRQPPLLERRRVRDSDWRGHRLDDCGEARTIGIRAAAGTRARGFRLEPDARASTHRLGNLESLRSRNL